MRRACDYRRRFGFLDYSAKSGREREIDINDAKVTRVIDCCEEIDGQFLFCYRDDDGRFAPVHSTDVPEPCFERERLFEPFEILPGIVVPPQQLGASAIGTIAGAELANEQDFSDIGNDAVNFLSEAPLYPNAGETRLSSGQAPDPSDFIRSSKVKICSGTLAQKEPC